MNLSTLNYFQFFSKSLQFFSKSCMSVCVLCFTLSVFTFKYIGHKRFATLKIALQEQWLTLPSEIIRRKINSITRHGMYWFVISGDHTPE